MDIPGMKVVPIISFAVVHNGIVSLCGVPADPIGDVKVQTRQVLERIDQLLQNGWYRQIETFGRPGVAGRHARF
jgi:enamine deaminase RidA (YjgF/YER057c/UK114 family)